METEQKTTALPHFTWFVCLVSPTVRREIAVKHGDWVPRGAGWETVCGRKGGVWDLGPERTHRKDLGRREKGIPDRAWRAQRGRAFQGSESCTLWLDKLRRNNLEQVLQRQPGARPAVFWGQREAIPEEIGFQT